SSILPLLRRGHVDAARDISTSCAPGRGQPHRRWACTARVTARDREEAAKMQSSIDRASIATLDQYDPLRSKRDAFVLPEGVIYLDGNSLGPVPKAALRELRIAAEQEWGEDLIRSWNGAGWFDLPVTLGDRIAPLIGAASGETVITDTTSINIYKAIHAGLNLRPGRSVIVAEGASFPTDIYMTQGVAGVRRDTRIRLEGVDAPRMEDLLGNDV